MRQMSYGVSSDMVDEYLRLSETSAAKCLKHFAIAVCEIFGSQYLRQPTENDVKNLLEIGESRGWPGMLGSLDCMHWEWKV